MLFADKAKLRFYEEILLDADGAIQRLSYAYGYALESKGPEEFRYEKDPEEMKPIVHEECHLHVYGAFAKGKRLRFKTHETSFEEVFTFIAAMYY